MYNTKQRIYLYLDKTQKSMLCTFLRSFVKQFFELDELEILDKFIYEQNYYLEINSSRFPFLADYLSNDEFLSETKEYISACKKYYQYKKFQEPIIAKQKEYEKQKKVFLQNLKMSKELPTKKQLYYYDRLCKRYNIIKKDVNDLSKLDLKEEIERILNEYSTDNINISE